MRAEREKGLLFKQECWDILELAQKPDQKKGASTGWKLLNDRSNIFCVSNHSESDGPIYANIQPKSPKCSRCVAQK